MSNSIIHDAHELSVREAKKCAPRTAAARKWEPIAIVLMLLFLAAVMLAAWFDKVNLSVLLTVLMSVSFSLCMRRQEQLSSSRTLLFGAEWNLIYSRWREIGLDPLRIGGMPMKINEVRKLYGWKAKENPTSTEQNLADLTFETYVKLLRDIEGAIK